MGTALEMWEILQASHEVSIVNLKDLHIAAQLTIV